MKLPTAPKAYDHKDEARVRALIEANDLRVLKTGQDVLLLNGERLVLISPNGTLYAVAVDNSGNLSTVSYP